MVMILELKVIVFNTKKGGLRKSQPLDLHQAGFSLNASIPPDYIQSPVPIGKLFVHLSTRF